ncbi:MAG: MoaD/ThiS family protein [Pedosphaera sp.]|nr:MoaD/ThiS family protein [Pedosphaera sp.]MSU40234.1 MoaD/ThiS family protein [Pedosphaera sp.]
MIVRVQFWSYFKDFTGCAETSESLPTNATVAVLLLQLYARFPKMAAMQNSTLIAVGVDYQGRSHVLKDGDDVSLFPPVQGG